LAKQAYPIIVDTTLGCRTFVDTTHLST
jgi:hypothetical protein